VSDVTLLFKKEYGENQTNKGPIVKIQARKTVKKESWGESQKRPRPDRWFCLSKQ